MKSIFGTSTCPSCGQKIAKGVEIEKKDGKWVHSVCDTLAIADKPQTPRPATPQPEQEALDTEWKEMQTEDPYKDCILGCVRAAEFFKSIDYPKELWNLSTIWNTERIKKK